MAKPPKRDTELMAKARAEACEVLHLDPDHLDAAAELRIDLFATLRLAIDAESAKAATASGVDLSKLNAAIGLMTQMLPTALAPPPNDRASRFKGDPAKRLVEIVTAAILRGPDNGSTAAPTAPTQPPQPPSPETAQPQADAPAPERSIPGDEPSNVTRLRAEQPPTPPAPAPQALDLRTTPADQRGGSAGFTINNAPEPWRGHVAADNGFFWSGAKGRSW